MNVVTELTEQLNPGQHWTFISFHKTITAPHSEKTFRNSERNSPPHAMQNSSKPLNASQTPSSFTHSNSQSMTEHTSCSVYPWPRERFGRLMLVLLRGVGRSVQICITMFLDRFYPSSKCWSDWIGLDWIGLDACRREECSCWLIDWLLIDWLVVEAKNITATQIIRHHQ